MSTVLFASIISPVERERVPGVPIPMDAPVPAIARASFTNPQIVDKIPS